MNMHREKERSRGNNINQAEKLKSNDAIDDKEIKIKIKIKKLRRKAPIHKYIEVEFKIK